MLKKLLVVLNNCLFRIIPLLLQSVQPYIVLPIKFIVVFELNQPKKNYN